MVTYASGHLVFIDVSPEKNETKNRNYSRGDLDDSGIVEDIEFVDVGDDFLDTGKDVIELDDDSFINLQSRLKDLMEEENNDDDNDDLLFKMKPCFVKIFKSPIFFEEENDRMERKRGRPAKNVDLNNFKGDPKNNSHKHLRRSGRVSTKKSNFVKKEKKVSLPKETKRPREVLYRNQRLSKQGIQENRKIIEIDLEDDDEDDGESAAKSVGVLCVKVPEIRDTTSDESEELCEYERIREQNIKERMDMFKSLGLKTDLQLFKRVPSSTTRNGKRKIETFDVERRKSRRLAAREDDDEYLPDKRDDEEEDSPSQCGARRHPCKECENCLKPDCKRCVFCRDKRKFGGKNIKKQRCLHKEKCSSPIINCHNCNGDCRSHSCQICNENFAESFQLEEHKEKVHNIEQVRRRSSRLQTKI